MPSSMSEEPPFSVWLRPERPRRDRRLSRERIVRATVALLDAEGVRGLSMRRIAADLEVTAGSLYWYVTTKDELMELAMDEVMGEVLGEVRERIAAPEGGWRAALEAMARGQRAMLLRHPWMLSDLASQPNLGPNALALADAGLRLLAGAGFRDGELDAALAAVTDHVVGAVAAEISWRTVTERAVTESTGAPAGGTADWRERAGGFLERVAEEYPLLGRRMGAGGAVDAAAESERRFSYALGCLLDGLEARRPGGRPSA
ncbi:TetR/AcrR family transcriptional regulator [Spirillospora sp. CA-255316]